MKRLNLREGRNEETVSLPANVAAAISALNVANVSPLGNGDWSISGVSKVGVIRVADWQVEITPKVLIDRLFFMMSFSTDQRFWQEQDVILGSGATLLDTIAHSFIRQAAVALGRGMHQAYETFDDALPIVRGRLDIPAQIGRRAGLALPAQVIFDEYTVDTVENRLLLSASLRLLHLPTLGQAHRAAIMKLTQRFEGVRPIAPGRPVPQVHFQRLNERYKGAVALSELILRNTSLEHRQGENAASGFLFDTWRIFEDFVSKALRASLARHGESVEMQSSSFLDQGREVVIRPDILVHSNGFIRAAVDAKYKSEKNGRFPHADVYQMLAYCLRFRLTEGHLVYARGEEVLKSYVIDPPGVTIHCHALNLDQTPEMLLADVDLLADRITRPVSARADEPICGFGEAQLVEQRPMTARAVPRRPPPLEY
ncbi:McrC family protein [Arthrobacter sp. NPDC057388]|uniref:McrC family protein n=1 Tax=Arthrobacter sp. NPDC057388 TaxID=3346116 RepID=UPI00362F0F8F